MNLIVKVNSNVNYFYHLLQFLKAIKPFSSLSPSELKILTVLIQQYYSKRKFSDIDRDLLVFSKSNKKNMRKLLKMSEASFDNYLSALRKKGFLTYGKLNPKFRLSVEKELNIKFVKI